MANPAALDAVNAKRKAQTHCLAGHEYTQENTRKRPNGCRCCKQCNRDRMKRNWMREQKQRDGIVDEIALDRAERGDIAVYEGLTKQEHRVLVQRLADRGARTIDVVPIRALREAVVSELNRREKRNGVVDRRT